MKTKPPIGWQPATVGDVCTMQNGNGFGPEDWGANGLPIIRIQNLNGGQTFDYYSGPVDPRWVVEPGQLLFAWAGTRGVSFGPTVWRGKRGVLNQHIFKISPRDGIEKGWLYWALREVTNRIEGQAHGFKATLLHVKKSDIERQIIFVPPEPEQRKISTILFVWDEAIESTKRLLANSQEQKLALVQRHFSASSPKRRASEIFVPKSVRRNGGLELLSVMQDVGVIPRSLLDRKVTMPEGSTEAYKLVEAGDFVISLRSFEGGLEYSRFKGLVSPAYTVLKPRLSICDDFYRHYFKSRDFIGRLSVAVIGIRDGKQINYEDFAFLKLPYPTIAEQESTAAVLNLAEKMIETLQRKLETLHAERRALMQQLLTGKRRVKLGTPVEEATAA